MDAAPVLAPSLFWPFIRAALTFVNFWEVVGGWLVVLDQFELLAEVPGAFLFVDAFGSGFPEEFVDFLDFVFGREDCLSSEHILRRSLAVSRSFVPSVRHGEQAYLVVHDFRAVSRGYHYGWLVPGHCGWWKVFAGVLET